MQRFSKKYRHRKQDWAFSWNETGEVVLTTPRGTFTLKTLHCTKYDEQSSNEHFRSRMYRSYSGPDGSLTCEMTENNRMQLTITYLEWKLEL